MNNYRIPEMAGKYTDYDMIQLHTELPPFPDFRTRLLYALLNCGPSGKQAELYALVTSLVQTGLDTHDMVEPAGPGESEASMRRRQLRVLAGDYFSGRFYQLLSQAGQIEMVRRLSQAIVRINQLKMNLYEKTRQYSLTAEEYMSEQIELKMQLFLPFAQWMEPEHSELWPELLHGISKCEFVMDELRRAEEEERFPGSWGFWQIFNLGTKEQKEMMKQPLLPMEKLRPIIANYPIRAKLRDVLRQSAEQVQSVAERLPSDELFRELSHIGRRIGWTFQSPMLKETHAT